jgi:hypothetical protein
LGDLCELAGRDVGETDEGSSFREIITTATMAKTLASKSELKTLGSLSLRIATIVLARILLVPAPSKIFSISRAQVRCHIFIKKSAIIVEKRSAIGRDSFENLPDLR